MLFFLLFSVSGNSQKLRNCKSEVTYLGNEGFMITIDSTKILIDALFKSKYYLSPPDSILEKIDNAAAPFDMIKYLFATHAHTDHISKEPASAFLSKNPAIKFISGKATCDSLTNYKGDLKNPFFCIENEMGEITEITDGELKVTAIRLAHTGNVKVNLQSFVIETGGIGIMHTGDAFIVLNESRLEKIDWAKKKIDVLFLGCADFNELALKFISNTIKPKKIVVMHIPPELWTEVKQEADSIYPDAILFEKLMEKKCLTEF